MSSPPYKNYFELPENSKFINLDIQKEKPKDLPKTKRCPGCKEDHDISRFGKNKSMADGLATYCKNCKNVKAKEFYLKKK